MFRLFALIALLALSACGKPAEYGLEGPVPRTSDWPFGDNSHALFRPVETDKYQDIASLEITKTDSVPTFHQTYSNGGYSKGEIWFHTVENSPRVGIARRTTSYSLDGKITETIKEPRVYYGNYAEVPTSEPLRIKLSDARCPYQPYDEKKPEAEPVPVHACQAKNAELTWALIEQYGDMLVNPQMLQMVNP